MVILGINAYHADASAALISDVQLVAAAEGGTSWRLL
jgi:predicted NodU family carbamoyl transferase